jgi:hypothetical protein
MPGSVLGNGTGSETAAKLVGFAPALECGERVVSDSSDVAVDAYVRLGVCGDVISVRPTERARLTKGYDCNIARK